MHPISRSFYRKDTLAIARNLIGCYLVRKYKNEYIVGRITETEAYIGAIDKACHAYGGRKTKRTETLYAQEGTSYVYLIYGMYHCMNVVTEPEGTASAVLIRGVEIVAGKALASKLRYGRTLEELSTYQKRNFTNGPGKLCKAMAIGKEQNGLDLSSTEVLFLTNKWQTDEPKERTIHISQRIGIDYAEEAKDFPWRFYTEGEQ